MRFHAKWCACTLVFAGLLIAGSPALCAQQTEHAVSTQELRQDVQRAAETRQANEAEVRQLLSTDAAQRAMKSINLNYRKVDQAVGQLDDEDLARMAERSREVQKDFAAGNLTDRDLLIILLCIAGLVLIIVAVR
jgi:Flp pilus assembly protein TadB